MVRLCFPDAYSFLHLFRTPADCRTQTSVAGRLDDVGPPIAIDIPYGQYCSNGACPVGFKGPERALSSAHQDKSFENCDRNHKEMPEFGARPVYPIEAIKDMRQIRGENVPSQYRRVVSTLYRSFCKT
jgi:hypothetical protein